MRLYEAVLSARPGLSPVHSRRADLSLTLYRRDEVKSPEAFGEAPEL